MQFRADLILTDVVDELNFVLLFRFLQDVSVAASPLLATIGMSVRPSVRPSVRHTLTLSENDASYDQEIFTDG